MSSAGGGGLKRRVSISKSFEGTAVNLVVHLGRSGERQVTLAHVPANEEEEAVSPPRSKKPRYESDRDVGSSSSTVFGEGWTRDLETVPVRVVVVTERDLATEIVPDLEHARAEVTRLRRERASNSQYLAQVLPAYLVEQFVDNHRLGMYDVAFDEDEMHKVHVRVVLDDQVVTMEDDLLEDPDHGFPDVHSEEMMWKALLAVQPPEERRRVDEHKKLIISREHSALLLLASLWLHFGKTPKEQFAEWIKESSKDTTSA
jgi:hypothetical protein